MKFEFSSDERVEHYLEEVQILIAEMGYEMEEVLVSDDSMVIDFYPFKNDDEEWNEVKNNLKKRYGIDACLEDKIWEVAERMRYGPQR
tara:strand:- start:26744 stop:27007 length:264 start_codon:yes stop_codon:yes gene_type:complete